MSERDRIEQLMTTMPNAMRLDRLTDAQYAEVEVRRRVRYYVCLPYNAASNADRVDHDWGYFADEAGAWAAVIAARHARQTA